MEKIVGIRVLEQRRDVIYKVDGFFLFFSTSSSIIVAFFLSVFLSLSLVSLIILIIMFHMCSFIG